MKRGHRRGPIDTFVKRQKRKSDDDDERYHDPFAFDPSSTKNITNLNNNLDFDPDALNFSEEDDKVNEVISCSNNFVWDPSVLLEDDNNNPIAVKKNGATLEPFFDIVRAIELQSKLPMSDEQHAICQFVYEKRGKLVIDSVAGSGKTTTLLQCLWFIPSDASVLILSFNKNIQQSMQSAVNRTAMQVMSKLQRDIPRCNVFTCHAHGLNAIKSHFQTSNDADAPNDNKLQVIEEVLKELQVDLETWKWHLAKMLRMLLNLAVDCQEETMSTQDFVVSVGQRYGICVPDTGPFQRSSLLST